MSNFQKRYLCLFAILVIGSSMITALVSWSNDFTFLRIAVDLMQISIYSSLFTWGLLKIEDREALKLRPKLPKPPEPEVPQVQPDAKPVWPPVVIRKD